MKKNYTINADIGEGCDDSLIMALLDWANIGCGAHAGSPELTKQTIQLAEANNVVVGAHPGYPDRDNFGRLSLNLTPAALHETLFVQIQLVKRNCQHLHYVKPHGALNHDMLQNDDIFATICRAVADNACQHVVVPTNARQVEQIAIAEQHQLGILWEVFADRAYEPNGLLRARKHADAVHQDPERIVSQIQAIRNQGEIVAIDGTVLDVAYADTICIHGDNAASVQAIRQLSQQ
ncbi:MAG: hypothetical protein CR974_01235 [Gammaproteobacteria bacterium]|nr:MAG: hypothetical protein CR974_01235 [Gammaproteobacteria bacterium]